MIIDSHVHYGKNSPWGDFSPEYLLNIMGEEIDFAICSNLEGLYSKNEYDCNMDMLEVTRKYSKLKALAVCEPHLTEDESVIRNFLETYPEFIGLKLHPECMKLPADSEKYNKYLRLAQEFKKPCLYHSGHIKSRFSSPELIYKKAQEFPEVPIILGHLSTGPRSSHERAIDILVESIEQNTATLYADVSWIDSSFTQLSEGLEDTLYLIERLKNTSKGDYTHRLMWASDAPVGEINQQRELYLNSLKIFKKRIMEYFNDSILLEDLLANNAKKLYSID